MRTHFSEQSIILRTAAHAKAQGRKDAKRKTVGFDAIRQRFSSARRGRIVPESSAALRLCSFAWESTGFSRIIALLMLALTLTASDSPGETGPAADSVSLRGGQMLAFREGKNSPLEETITFPNDIKVKTNGTFTVKGAKPRKLEEGQMLSRDGTLTSPDGSIAPVMDHLTMKAGKVVVVRDGQSTPLDAPIVLPDGTGVTADGSITLPTGKTTRLLDGQLLRIEGGTLPVKDTITLQNGQVVVQKDGSLLRVARTQRIMMSDGTKVFGNGTVIMKDGKSVRLSEGKILEVEGVVRRAP